MCGLFFHPRRATPRSLPQRIDNLRARPIGGIMRGWHKRRRMMNGANRC